MKCIVIATAGFVFIGERVVRDNETTVLLENASIIRVWGTARGLGQIALEGPTRNTIIDPVGQIEVHYTAVIAVIACRV